MLEPDRQGSPKEKGLKTRFPGVYAVGDMTSVGTAKAGVFSEGAARVVAASLIAELGELYRTLCRSFR